MAEHADASRQEVSKTDQPETSPAAPSRTDERSYESLNGVPEVQADDAEDYDGAVATDVDDDPKDVAAEDAVKKAQSKSVGTVTEAGLESQSGDEAQVLVGVSVNTSNLGAAEEEPRHWRMRIFVKKVGDEAKVSNVAFVQ